MVSKRVVVRYARLVTECCKRFTRGVRVVQRRNERLNHAESAIEGARIAPGFEVVRFGDMPIAEFGGLVKVRADVDSVLDGLTLPLFVKSQLGRKVEIVRCRVDRINAKNEKCFDLPIVDVAAQFA